MNLLPTKLNPKPPAPRIGLHDYERNSGSDRAKIHLRIEEDGRGLLLINANRVFHLNPTATYMAWLILEEQSEDTSLRAICQKYRVSRSQARADLSHFKEQLNASWSDENACPIHDLEFEVLQPFSETPTAPYRMDLALTYRCNANCHHCYNARPRNYPELETSDWVQMIDRLWEIGVPHVCFTGGEATLREDLPVLINHASQTGQVTGLLSNGRKLGDPTFVHELKLAGLDHVQITFESYEESIHDQMVAARGAWKQTLAGIRNCLDQGLYLMTNTTLLEKNARSIGALIDFLAEQGVRTVGFNALIYAGKGTNVGTGLAESELPSLLEIARERTDRHGQRLIWYTPTQYCHFDPVQMQLGVKACTAALYNMCVEPDGGVIPCQSYYHQLGNLLEDPWDQIWNHEISKWLRNREYVPETCQECPVLPECGGGCPLTLLNQPDQQPIPLAEFPGVTLMEGSA